MGWQDVAAGSLGAQSSAVSDYLARINPGYDWTTAIRQAAGELQTSYSDGGWQDPSRGSSAAIANQILGDAQARDASAPQDRSVNATLWATSQQQNAQIQAEQAKHGGGSGLGMLLAVASLAAGGAGLLGAFGDLATAGSIATSAAPEIAWGTLDAGPAAIAVDSEAAGLVQAANAASTAATTSEVVSNLKTASQVVSAAGTLARAFGGPTTGTAQIAPSSPIGINVLPAFANPVQPAAVANGTTPAVDGGISTGQQLLAGIAVAAALAFAFYKKG